MESDLKCYKCGSPLPPFDFGKVPFRAYCENCNADLHACINCKNYSPGKPNDCLVPGTEFVPDRTRSNFCEDFELLGKKQNTGGSKDTFNNLFKD